MCYGCMSFTQTFKFLQKQLNFLYASPIEQIELAKNNKLYDPNKDNIPNYIIGVENLLLPGEWNKDKINLYIGFANGIKGRLASMTAMKLLFFYEEWLVNAPSIKQKEYKNLCKENMKELKRIDSWFIKNEYNGKDQKCIKVELKELDELYDGYENAGIIGYL